MATLRRRTSLLKSLVHGLLVLAGAVVLTLIFFLVLPFMQTIGEGPDDDLLVREADTIVEKAPETIQEPEPEDEPEPEEPPELEMETSEPLSLEQLTMALNPSAMAGGGWSTEDFAGKLAPSGGGGGSTEEIFSMAALDQKPRVVQQAPPRMTAQIRRQGAGTVKIIFIVNAQGDVVNPIVQSSTHPVFEKAALAAVKQWKFEPGKRNGKPVAFRMRVPISFGG